MSEPPVTLSATTPTSQPDAPQSDPPRNAYDIDDSLGYLVARVRQLIMAELTKETSQYGLTSTQATMLYKVATGKSKTAADLARDYCIDASAVTRLLDRLEAHGLLVRERSKMDRRTVNLSATEAGYAMADRMPDIFVRAADHLMRGFSVEEVGFLKSLLRRVIANGESG
ncbi:MarR family winged helix-turn-helix transcriptional regulator [Pandoraea fibrosis]|uniref:MarR family transcriptional regulator n=2 Tax=Pandoraea fibrosis TaxID=1891094 RepID=A0A5E4XD92_9BURK|nr:MULTISPECIES: MarR family transcriptional regulator [Pandoraea]MDR3399054.1 MarR family transcriptional regulator [Pandoraea sp.]VVE34246.1 MarR family transcriptional regulator [Pandoraea fibrosis]